MFELGLELDRERKKLVGCAKQYRKFNLPADSALIAGYAITLIIIFTQEDLSKEASLYDFWVFAPTLVSWLVFGVLSYLAKPYKLSPQERVFLNVCSALDDLGSHLEDERRPYRKRAQKKIEKVSRQIEKWNVLLGRLEFTKNIIGSHFEPFNETFYTKIVGALRKGKKDDLINAFLILKGFAKFLTNPDAKTEHLDSMHQAMNTEIRVEIPSRVSLLGKAFHFLENISKHIAVVIVSIISGFFIGYVGHSTLRVSIEVAYSLGVTVVLGIIVAYLNYLRKR